MWYAVALSLLGLGVDVEAVTLSGERAAGSLSAVTADGLVLRTDNGEARVAANELLTIKHVPPPGSENQEKPRVWIELIDDSKLFGLSYTSANGTAKFTLLGGETLDIPTRSIRSVRFQEQDSEMARQFQLAKQWREILSSEPHGDLIIIRKVNESEAEDGEGEVKVRMSLALDQLEGVLGDISAEKVAFEYENQQIPVARTKVEGIRYFHPAGRELPDPLCRCDDVYGNQWNLKSVTLVGDKLQLVSVSGVKADLQLTHWRELDYSAGKVAYLSDLEPEKMEWTNYFGTTAASPNLAKLFAPRRDRDFEGHKLSLAGREYEKGLALHSKTLVEYRLQGKYSKFLALAGIDDGVRPAGDLSLVVMLDGKRLGEHRLRGNDESPLNLEYDVRGGRKLSLLVDFGEGLDVSDRLHLVNARVTK